MFLIIIQYAVLAATFTLAKKSLFYATPLLLLLIRFWVAGLLLLGYSMFFTSFAIKKIQQDWGLFLCTALLHTYLAFVPEFYALTYMSSTKVSIMYSLTPFVAALLASVFEQYRIGKTRFFAIVLAVVSVAPITFMQAEYTVPTHLFFDNGLNFSLPEAMLLLAVVSGASAWFFVKRLLARGHAITTINAFALIGGGVMMVPTVFFFEPQAAITSWAHFLPWFSLLLLTAHGISYNLYGWLLTRYSIPFMTLCGFMCPFFTALYGNYFLNEQLHWQHAASLIGFTCALVIFYRADRLHERRLAQKKSDVS